MNIAYKGQKLHKLKIGLLNRRLPIVKINKKTWIASFVMLGDVELIEYCAKKLTGKLKKDFDIIVVPEAKAIPLAHAIAKNINNNVRYCVIRKSRKAYFGRYISVPARSITTKNAQRLYLTEEDIKKIKGKMVCLIDDVISTGGTIEACVKLVKKAGGKVHQIASVLREGNPDLERLNKCADFPLVYLGSIPVYSRSEKQ